MQVAPCLRQLCAPRNLVTLRIFRDSSDSGLCLMQIKCPPGSNVFVTDGTGYVKYSGSNPIQCVDNGQGTGVPSVWTTVMPGFSGKVQHVSCLSKPLP
ncbi:hypothetical protein OESDEN_06551 [Oesophagostomum dentatum]|uniref:Uncharacterized protein n=1 Tax=Oesophagostomum dentatum TaxID=61180 RepID=A0A0B1TBL9_OESDE|nr:hypothetical protein OESDEN_06551 [Oesophagostomum dentatum]